MTQLKSIRLETPRLYIIPLSLEQLLMYLKSDDSLESELGISLSGKELTQELLDTIHKFMVPYIIDYPEYILFATVWIIIDKDQKTIVGDIGFKSAPSSKGLVEIGYGTYPDFRNKGFMTEAVSAITNWAFDQPEIQIVLAETDKNNKASQNILIKNRFQPFAETETMYWWRLDREIEQPLNKI